MQNIHRSGRVIPLVRSVLGQVTDRVGIMLTNDAGYARATYLGLAALLAEQNDGPRVRLLCGESVFDEAFLSAQAARGRRIQARITGPAMSDLILVDGRMALVRTGRPGERKAAIVEDPLCVQALEALFTEVWRGSVAAPDRTSLGATASPDLRARVLGQLNSGVTDDVAARELSVSVRTYRRHVAEILTTLRADSRFQAGVRAARLGLVAPEPHAPAGGPRLLRRRGVGQAVTES